MRSAVFPVLVALLAPSAIWAAETPGTWHKSCETPKGGQPHCVAEQIAVAEPGDRPVLRLTVEAQANNQARLAALAPLGISLRQGLDLVVDGASPIKLPFERCTPQGCEASAILDQAALEKFVKGTTLTVGFAPSDTQSASVPLKLDGLAATLKTVSK